jgi:tRNA A-37 threonylcarbamoyl transferase component Bud32
LANIENIQNQEVGKKKQKKMSIDDNRFKLPNYIDLASMNIERDIWADEPGYGKRAELRENFIREATIQNEVYNISINNGPLCPEIYGSYIVDNNRASAFLELLLKTKCRDQLEGKNMIEYLQKNVNRYELGMIRMEYAEGYITFREAPENQTLYENVIYANIRLLMETGYMHLDLNPGNVMVLDNEILLIDFGKTKDLIEIIQTFGKKNVEDFERIREIVSKPDLTVPDIETIIDFIIKCEEDYLYDLHVLNRNKGLFHINFVSKLSNPEGSYQNIANKLNERENKTISPKYGQLQQILQNTAVSSNSPQINDVLGLFGLSSSPKRKGLSYDSDSENTDSNNISKMNLSTPPRTPGGAKKSKKTKRKPLHNKRKSKTHKKKSNKKRVKLISNK